MKDDNKFELFFFKHLKYNTNQKNVRSLSNDRRRIKPYMNPYWSLTFVSIVKGYTKWSNWTVVLVTNILWRIRRRLHWFWLLLVYEPLDYFDKNLNLINIFDNSIDWILKNWSLITWNLSFQNSETNSSINIKECKEWQ